MKRVSSSIRYSMHWSYCEHKNRKKKKRLDVFVSNRPDTVNCIKRKLMKENELKV